EHSPGHYSVIAAFVIEVVLTAGFLFVIMGATDRRAPAGFAPIAIGLALTLIHLISIPITNTSVNPARSTGPAILVGGWALAQLWLFWLAPILGAIAGAAAYRRRLFRLGALDLDVDLKEGGLAGLTKIDADHVVADLDIAADHLDQFALQSWQEIGCLAAGPLMRQHDLEPLLGNRGAGG